MDSVSEISKKVLTPALLLLIVAGYGILFWACNKGIDLTDESFYLMGYFHRDSPDLFPSMFFHVYDAMFGGLARTLWGARLVRVVLTILACLVLGRSLTAFLEQSNPASKRFTLFLLLAGGIGTFAWGPMAISYNSFASVFLMLMTGSWLAIINRRGKVMWLLVFAVSLSLLFLVKFTAAILFGCVLLLIEAYRFWRNKPTLKSIIVNIGWGLLGVVLALLFVFKTPIELIDELERVRLAIEDRASVNYGSSYLLGVYIKDVLNLFGNTWVPLIVSLLLSVGIRKFSSNKTLGALVLLIFFFGFAVFDQWYLGGTQNKYQLARPYFVFVVCVLVQLIGRLDVFKLIVAVLFIIVPFVAAAGTSNGLSAQIIFSLPFITVLPAFMINESTDNETPHVFILAFCVVSVLQGLTGTLLHPYRDVEDLFSKTEEIENGGAYNGQYLGPRHAAVYDELRECEDVDIEYVFTLRHQMGLTLLMNKMPISFDWMNETFPDRVCELIAYSEIPSHGKMMLILPKEFKTRSEIEKCLRREGINLNSSFEVSKEITYYSWDKQKEIVLQVFMPVTEIK